MPGTKPSNSPRCWRRRAAMCLKSALPLTIFADFEAGDDFRLAAVVGQDQRDLQVVPANGPAQVVLPDLGTSTVVLSVDDPQGDDHGPGSYTYPTDGVFQPGVFDIKHFEVSHDAKNLIFKLSFNGPIPNPWGSPNNLAVQTLDSTSTKIPARARARASSSRAAMPHCPKAMAGMWRCGPKAGRPASMRPMPMAMPSASTVSITRSWSIRQRSK